MGMTYVLLPQLGFSPVRGRLAGWQPAVYGGGQLMHVLGLAWSGGYGVERKLAGADQVLTGSQALGMGLMGAGSLLAVVGGLMFVLACLRSMIDRAGRTSG
ncbi:MAG TPA: cytochrome C oxidase subunit I, partial [Burkholderiaceae bacterium]